MICDKDVTFYALGFQVNRIENRAEGLIHFRQADDSERTLMLWLDDKAFDCKGAILLEALRQWKCPACGGSRRYTGYSKEARTKDPQANNRFDMPCKKCGEDGLNPIASEAIRAYQATS